LNNPDSHQSESVALSQSHTLPAGPVGLEQREARLEFPVVGIGASAGGVEALSELFRAAPPRSGMAFVVIQHLSPDAQSFMAEILAKCTPMRVVQIQDGVRVEPDTVYVIRPGFTVTLSEGTLRLGEPVERRGHRRPVDDFFRSLAVEQKESAIIVILSGTGTNGTAGAQAVKAAGGLCVAQDPETAEFPGMPRSLVHSGYADQVLAPEKIVEFVVGYVHHPLIEVAAGSEQAADTAQETVPRERQSLSEIQALLRIRTGHDFRGYRKPTLLRRIQRRMGIAGVIELAEYVRRLREREDEAPALANDLMINVTGFFRDPEAWEALREGAVAPLVANAYPGQPLRAWVTACSSGEEPYSLAILIAEECRRTGKLLETKIFATDTADKSLALARAGVYPAGIEGDIDQQRLDRFFDKDEHTYRVKKEIRDMVVFAPQNLLRDPPFSRVDLCTCRNFLIYLEPDTQQRVLSLLAFAVRDGGSLFLGNTESLGDAEQGFETVSRRWRIYRRIGPAQHRFIDIPYSPRLTLQDALETPAVIRTSAPPSPAGFSYERALLEEFTPPSVIVDRQEHVLYVYGDTASFLAFPTGELTNNLFEVVRAPLRAAVRSAFRQAVDTHVAVTIDTPSDSDDSNLLVRITAGPLKGRSAGRCLRVSFELRPLAGRSSVADEGATSEENATRPPLVLQADSRLEDEVRILRRELQASVEAFEATNEELKASNEEVLSINEELQSANEELETSKEELQSLNEELTTVNGQLHAKIGEFEHLTNDLSNLLSSTSIAVVFLDTQLLVRRFTPAVQDLFELIPTDLGRSISNLAPKFTMSNGGSAHDCVRNIARTVLDNLMPVETEVFSDSGRFYLQRTLPYRTGDNHIEGVVLTFVDITARKSAEQSILRLQARLHAALEQLPAAIIVAETPGGTIVHANRHAAELFGQSYPPPFLHLEWQAAALSFRGRHADGRAYAANEWPLARSLTGGEVVVDEQIEIVGSGNVVRALSVSSAPVRDENDAIIAAVTAFWDITRLKTTEHALRESERRLRFVVENAHDFAILSLDIEGHVTAWSAGAEHMFQWTETEMLGRSVETIFAPAEVEGGVPEREMQTALREGKAADDRWHVRKDGTPLWVNGVLSVARNASGEAKGFVKIMRDNTEKKETEDRLYAATLAAREAQSSAEAANRAKDDFISMISHELRTPLNTMRLWVRLLGHAALPEKDRAEGRRALERAVISQQQLIDDLLDVSRISSGKLRLEMRPTRLAQTIQTAVEAVRPVSLRKGIELSYTASSEIGVVLADPDRMQQIVWNLLSNAVKFTPSGGQVRVELASEAAWTVIRVTDTGIGIAEDLMPHIFDRFRQGESGTARQHGGLGLGLAIAKQLTELHGGTIAAGSDGNGQGACFTVQLPLKVAVESQPEPPTTSAEGESLLAGRQVLLVEDEASAREGTRVLLETKGAIVQCVESADAAKDAYQVRRPSILISDIGLPGEDGYVLIQQIRAFEQEHGNPRVPAMALTAFARNEDRQHAFDAGYDAHVTKPVDPDKLLAEIARLLIPSSRNIDDSI
jgi:two-component system CheB/CheR fusion protein